MKRIFIPLSKVDEEQRLVYGVAAVEQVDKANEIFDYAGSKPLFEKWSGEINIASDGKSYGNVREMHEKSAAGKLSQPIGFDDVTKSINICAKVVDDSAWKKVVEGVYTGFSIGGGYVKRWTDETIKTAKRYIAEPSEISLVDNPCMPGATFEFIKSAGKTAEKRAFLPALGTFEKDEASIGASLYKVCEALGGSQPGEGAHEKALRVMKRAKEMKVDASGFAKAYVESNGGETGAKLLAKGLYDVSDIASILMQLNYCQSCLQYEAEYEGDGSEIPARLKDVMTQLGSILVDLATEETNELLAAKSAADKIGKEITEMKKFWKDHGGTIEKLTKSEDAAVKAMADQLVAQKANVEGVRTAFDALGKSIATLDGEAPEPEAPAEKLSKAADGRITKLEENQGEIVKALGNINESFQALLKGIPAPSKVAVNTHAVSKVEDTPGGEVKKIDPKDPDAARNLMKNIHAAGPTLSIVK